MGPPKLYQKGEKTLIGVLHLQLHKTIERGWQLGAGWEHTQALAEGVRWLVRSRVSTVERERERECLLLLKRSEGTASPAPLGIHP